MKNLEIDILIRSKKCFLYFKDEKSFQKKIEEICQNLFKQSPLKEILKNSKFTTIAFTFTNNQQIKKINQHTRNKDKSTNVLSFPHFSRDEIEKIIYKNIKNNYTFLGDIIISCEKIDQEAKKQNKIFKNHLTHLILHSILHLLGFDHESEAEAIEMENLEIKILENLNIKNPYINI